MEKTNWGEIFYPGAIQEAHDEYNHNIEQLRNKTKNFNLKIFLDLLDKRIEEKKTFDEIFGNDVFSDILKSCSKDKKAQKKLLNDINIHTDLKDQLLFDGAIFLIVSNFEFELASDTQEFYLDDETSENGNGEKNFYLIHLKKKKIFYVMASLKDFETGDFITINCIGSFKTKNNGINFIKKEISKIKKND